MTLPDNIVEYLQTDYLERRRPFCLTLDAEYRLQDTWGYADSEALSRFKPGDDMLEYAPFLLGQLETDGDVLPFVTMSTGETYEVHILPEDDLFYVILLDASHEHDNLQRQQQTANEIRLLHANQQRLISRQRDLIGDLVEAKAELDHRRREAERTNASKSRFIAMMSHEFRTPLASIINYADLALEDSAGPVDIRKSNEAIARASRHLTMLVDTVLDDARLEAGNVQIRERPFDPRQLIDDMATIMAPLAAEKGLSFAAHVSDFVPACIQADDIYVRQILINLLGNAVKYTELGGVTLALDWEAGEINITVADTGPGISLVDRDRIFRAFERGSDTTDDTPGAGLGLAITLDLARLMGGRIDLQSEVESGCHIVVVLPAPEMERRQTQDEILPMPEAEHQASRLASILLCDDDEDMLALAEYYMHRAGYGLILARDGLEAVEKALAYQPDLILMDINTPRLNGSDATTRLRNAGFDNPIVALTASDIRTIDNDHFTAYLRKPVQMPKLLTEIKQQLQEKAVNS